VADNNSKVNSGINLDKSIVKDSTIINTQDNVKNTAIGNSTSNSGVDLGE
jgi:hypothetical protein